MNDETSIKVSFKNNVNGEKKIEKYAEQLERIYAVVSALDSGESKSISQIRKEVGVLNKNTKEAKGNVERLSNQFNTMFNISMLKQFSRTATSFFEGLTKLSKNSSDYIENVNLLEVAYSNANETIEESSKRIESFIDRMSEVYGLDESRLTRQFGIFKQLANAMKLPTDTAEDLSEIMVKMTNDVASLYNLDLNRASNALQSALVGQVRPINSSGLTLKSVMNKIVNTSKSGVRVITMLFKQEMAY